MNFAAEILQPPRRWRARGREWKGRPPGRRSNGQQAWRRWNALRQWKRVWVRAEDHGVSFW